MRYSRGAGCGNGPGLAAGLVPPLGGLRSGRRRLSCCVSCLCSLRRYKSAGSVQHGRAGSTCSSRRRCSAIWMCASNKHAPLGRQQCPDWAPVCATSAWTPLQRLYAALRWMRLHAFQALMHASVAQLGISGNYLSCLPHGRPHALWDSSSLTRLLNFCTLARGCESRPCHERACPI